MDALAPTYSPPNLLGRLLCLDFVNTVDPRFGPQRREYLSDYAEMLAWSRHVNILDKAQATTLRRVHQAHPDNADLVTRKPST